MRTRVVSAHLAPSGSGSYAYTTARDDPTTVTMPISSFLAGLAGVLVPDDREFSAGVILGSVSGTLLFLLLLWLL